MIITVWRIKNYTCRNGLFVRWWWWWSRWLQWLLLLLSSFHTLLRYDSRFPHHFVVVFPFLLIFCAFTSPFSMVIPLERFVERVMTWWAHDGSANECVAEARLAKALLVLSIMFLFVIGWCKKDDIIFSFSAAIIIIIIIAFFIIVCLIW